MRRWGSFHERVSAPAAVISMYLPATHCCNSRPAPHEAEERGCSEAAPEQGYTMCISALGIEFDLHLRSSKPCQLWVRNAYELSTVGLHWVFVLYLLMCMYQVPDTVPGIFWFRRTGSACSVTIISPLSFKAGLLHDSAHFDHPTS